MNERQVMTCRLLFRFLAACAVLTTNTARAGGSVFSSDGKKVYTIQSETEMAVIEVATGTMETVKIPGLPEGAKLQDAARIKDGGLLLLTDFGMWEWKGNAEAVTKRWEAPKDTHLFDVAIDPVKGGRLILAGSKKPEDAWYYTLQLYWWAEGAAEPVTVRSRRVDNIKCIAYTPNGELLFSSHGDLWMGEIEDGEDTPVLVAERVIPLASLETYGGTPMGEGINDLAVAGNHVYAALSRLGGSGWGRMVQMKLPVREENDKKNTEPHWVRAAKALQSVKEYDGNGYRLCVSPDGRLVYYKGLDGQGHRLVQDGTDPNPTGPEHFAKLLSTPAPKKGSTEKPGKTREGK